uniref:39S ribosomal protein L1, mitochondrial n=1 Tax=Cuerna arida TaxID=1464854 RepID=A0A1B6FXW7_9HEMI
MELIKTGRVLSCCNYYFKIGFRDLLQEKFRSPTFTNVRNYAARKGYREAAKKKKVKTVIQKQGWIPHNLRKKDVEELSGVKRSNEHLKQTATDDVWVTSGYAWRIFDFKEAVECHRETHHPTIYNVPDAQINLFIELDMTTAKPTKFVEKFRRMAILPHVYEQDGLQERSILVFCKTPEQKEAAKAAGANLVGGTEIIKDIEKGKIVLPDFRFILAHPTILPEMVTIRGLLKKKFPNVKSGTLGPNLDELVTRFKNGVEYSCVRDEKDLSYGWINTSVGRLNMDTLKLEENFQALLKDIIDEKPKRPGPFITRVVMTSLPSVEKFKINFEPHLPVDENADGESSDEDEAVPVKA